MLRAVVCFVAVCLPVEGYSHPPGPAAAELGQIRQEVEALDPGGGFFRVILYGGEHDRAGNLRGACVAICTQNNQVVWDKFDRRFHPFLLRSGRFAGENVVLIGVRKATPLDPVERPRPFLYALRPSGKGLRKVWLGSSLSRPFLTLDFGNLDGVEDDELIALEYSQAGGLSLAAYRWVGFGVEGIARTPDIHGACEVRCADVWGGTEEEVVILVTRGAQWRFAAYALAHDVLRPVAEVRVMVGKSDVVWETVAKTGDGPGAVRVARGAVVRVLPFRPVGATGPQRSRSTPASVAPRRP